MNKFNKKLVSIALAVPISFSVWAGNNSNGTMQNGSMGGMQNNMMGHAICQPDASQIELRTLSQQEIDSLKFMREEEKLARDVYQVLYEQTLAMVFGNITQSEQKHMDRVGVFLEAYGIPDPAKEQVGEFTDQSLQTLHDDLLIKASVSDLEAYKVGALIEEVDIEDLELAIENTDIAELKAMYTNLRDASYKHLRAFTKQIIAIEGNYTAQVLDQTEVDEILTSANVAMQMGNAIKVMAIGEATSSSCFTSNLTAEQKTLQNGSSVAANQSVTVAYQVKVDATEVGQAVDWIMLVNYADNNWFVRSGDQWLNWDGTVGELPVAATGFILQDEQTIPVFEGVLNDMPGKYAVYIGYRMEDNSLVYKPAPLVFTVK